MVTKGMVLLRIQHLQKRGGRVTTEIRSHFIHLIQEEHGVHAACNLHAMDNATGHGADIGAAVAANFGFITNAAQGYAGKLAADSLSNAKG